MHSPLRTRQRAISRPMHTHTLSVRGPGVTGEVQVQGNDHTAASPHFRSLSTKAEKEFEVEVLIWSLLLMNGKGQNSASRKE